MLYYRSEGENFHWGLNIDRPTDRTKWAFTLVLPLPYATLEEYESYLTGDRVLGLRIWACMFGVRRRTLPIKGMDHLFWYKFLMREVGSTQIIYTLEERQDDLHHGDEEKSKAIKRGLAASVWGLG